MYPPSLVFTLLGSAGPYCDPSAFGLVLANMPAESSQVKTREGGYICHNKTGKVQAKGEKIKPIKNPSNSRCINIQLNCI